MEKYSVRYCFHHFKYCLYGHLACHFHHTLWSVGHIMQILQTIGVVMEDTTRSGIYQTLGHALNENSNFLYSDSVKPTLIQTWKSVRRLKIFALAPRHISLKSWLTRQFSFSSDTPLRKSTLVPFFLSDILSEEKVFAKRKGLELFSDRELYNNKRKSIESQWC